MEFDQVVATRRSNRKLDPFPALEEQYEINGYVVVPSLFNSDEVDLLRKTTNDIIESARGKTQSDAIHDLEDSHDPKGAPRVRRIKDPVQQFDAYDALARNEKLLKRPSQIMVDKILTLRQDRIRKKIGVLDSETIKLLNRALMIFIGLV